MRRPCVVAAKTSHGDAATASMSEKSEISTWFSGSQIPPVGWRFDSREDVQASIAAATVAVPQQNFPQITRLPGPRARRELVDPLPLGARPSKPATHREARPAHPRV